MNRYEYIEYGQKIIKDLKECGKHIILYGNGSIGNYVYGVLKNYCNISGYCVSDNVSHEDTFNGLPVFEVSKIPYARNDCKILLTLDSKHWEPAKELLSKNDFVDYAPFSVEQQNALLSFYYQDLFLEHSIDMESKIIEINGVMMRNPFLLDEIDYKAVFIEMNDLVMGDILNDNSLWSEGPYLYGNVDLAKGDVVFDCGANLGLFSCIAASKGCISYAFEPTERLYNALNNYISLYNHKIIPCNYALSDKNGFIDFAISREWDVANTFVTDKNNSIVPVEGYSEFVRVKTTTIDHFVQENNIERVDFIKADIEGAERFMLKGAKETLLRFAPRLSICTYHFKDDPQVLEEIIKSANPNYIIEHRWKKLYAYVKK
ncbi:MAG: FkbM family methyltransferase [Bacillota bacterium]